jgi:hypothetical protein
VTDNLAVTAADFTRFSMVVPTDSRLTTSGQTITGLYNVVPEKFGLEDNYNTLSDKYGKQTERWNGVDVSLNARMPNGLLLQAGVSSGKTVEDNCEVIAALPEMNEVTGGNASGTPGGVMQWRPAEFCHREEPMLTQFKGYGIYTIPRVDVQLSGTFRSTPGTSLAPAFTATNAYLAGNSTLGRPLSGGATNMVVGIEVPNDVYIDRRNELDLRFGKVLRVNRYKSVVSLDLYNALNTDALIRVNQSYAAYMRPTEILNARVAKITATFEF